jgi:hypothetical protein
MTGHEVLRQLLPPEVEVPTSFETIGHVLHLNLKEQVPTMLMQLLRSQGNCNIWVAAWAV